MKPPQHTEPGVITLFRIIDPFAGACIFSILCILYGVERYRYLNNSMFIFLTVVVVFTYYKVYRTWQIASLLAMVEKVIKACILVIMLFLSILYFLDVSGSIPKELYILWLSIWGVLIILFRLLYHWLVVNNIIHGMYIHNAIIYGINTATPNLINWIQNNTWYGINIKSIFLEKGNLKDFHGIPVLIANGFLPKYVSENNINIVYISQKDIDAAKIDQILKDLSDTTTAVFLVSDIFSQDYIQNARVMYLGDLLVFSLFDTPYHGVNLFLKRMEDIIISSIIIILSSPLLLFASIGIKITSPGSIFFKQWRYGLNGKPIKIIKFRTMNVEEDGFVFHQVQKNDKRITPFGRFLRRTSIDELPQLFNVLLGEMSIIGPRPHAISMVEEYRRLFPGSMLRHMIKPGITGLAQIYGTRGPIDDPNLMKERVKYDKEYMKKWSLYLDIKILALTVVSLFTKEVY